MDEMIKQCTQMMSGMGSMMGGNMMGNMAGGQMMNGAFGWASPGYWLGWAFVLSVLVILFALIWGLRYAGRSASRRESPLDVLKRRYAQGEIDSEHFEAIKRQLAGG